MEETEILCPECMKEMLVTENGVEAHCDKCGTDFIITGKNQVKYV